MSTSHLPDPIGIDISSVMNNLNVTEDQVNSTLEPPSEVMVSFETLRENLAGKLQGKNQTARHFAAEAESMVLTICHQYPQEMSESRVAEWKKIQFYKGLKRMYRESFEHLYEEGASFEELLDAVVVMEEALRELQKPSKEEKQEETHLLRSKKKPKHKKKHSWGWARTGLEPEVVVYVNDHPLDALLDLGCDASFIDQEISDDLGVKVNSYDCTIAQCVGMEVSPCTVSTSFLKVIGWIEIEMGILGIGCVTARLWVTQSLFNKGVPIVIGSHLIKKILAQANLRKIDCWQQPWRFIYEGYAEGQWCADKCLEELTDSDNSFEVVHRNHLSPSCLERLESSTPTEEEQIREVERQIAQSSSTALKGIPGPLEEPDGQEDLTPAAPKDLPLPEEVEKPLVKNDDEQSVFASLAQRLDESAAEAESFPCNSKVIVQTALSSVRLPPFPAVSCKITPTGETVFSLQWEPKYVRIATSAWSEP